MVCFHPATTQRIGKQPYTVDTVCHACGEVLETCEAIEMPWNAAISSALDAYELSRLLKENRQ